MSSGNTGRAALYDRGFAVYTSVGTKKNDEWSRKERVYCVFSTMGGGREMAKAVVKVLRAGGRPARMEEFGNDDA